MVLIVRIYHEAGQQKHKIDLPGFIWVCNLICRTERGTQTEDVREHSAEQNIRTEQGDSKRRVEKICNEGSCDLYLSPNINPLKPELNSICYLLALLAHHFLHVSRIRVKSLTSRRLMSYIYMEHPFLMFLDHTQRRSTVGRTPLDE